MKIESDIFFLHIQFTAPGDYQSLNVVITIPAGGTQHFVEIPIGVEYNIEHIESFEIVLSNPSESATIAEPVATINIIDVDSKCCYACIIIIILVH